MSISQVNAQQSLRATQAVAAMRANAARSQASATGRQPDVVSLSDTARALDGARQAASSAPDVREDRVAALKAAIASGTYPVDNRQLARSMLAAGVFGQATAAS
jgi:negative regulator of flagellin synthesis FlgM